MKDSKQCTWVFASDGRGGRPFGFFCERCLTSREIRTPIAVEDYLKACSDFIGQHRKCAESTRPGNELPS